MDNNSLTKIIDKAKIERPDYKIVGTTAHHAESIDSVNLSLPMMLMVGNETMGLNKTYKSLCDKLCTIPMDENANASSFNVSCAASIVMYEVIRQRRMHEIRNINTGENI